ncbi:MAG: UDP-3-O-(3-hydroxymyristoyl)glucosamine N-acyltransferase [Candidatus Adiutrix sp.]|nr:UDP-3-O-(3-hydroxymyristoyl)glucosamine N-acyltransferase [Candidatus Adiutrix sp.]
MKLTQPRPLGQLIEEAAREIAARLAKLGAAEAAPSLTLAGDGATLIESLTAADEAGPGALTFAVDAAYLKRAAEAGAAAVIAAPEAAGAVAGRPGGPPLVVCSEPRLVFAVILALAAPAPEMEDQSEAAFFADRATLTRGEGVAIGAGAYIGRHVRLGRGVRIAPRAHLEDGVSVGEDCLIHAGAVLRRGTRLGRRCLIHAGAVIGDDGFGYAQLPAPGLGRLIHFKNDHVGGVVIEDDVEIGANSCIDRGLVTDTVIGRGAKIDNLVQIGHNCRIGQDCVIVAQTGIGGHAVVGDRVFLLGQAGLGPGVVIGHDAVVTAQSGLGSGAIPPGRRPWTGTPARPMEKTYQTAALAESQLPRLRRFLQIFKKSASFEELKKAFFNLGDQADAHEPADK